MFGDRLRLARKKAGYSLRTLSDALDGEVTAQAIGKYERGEMMPSSKVLSRLTRVLGVSLQYLLSEEVDELEGVAFRKLSSTSARDRARVEAEVIDRLQRYLTIEEILGLDNGAWRTPRLGNRFVGQEDDGEIVADDMRHEWRLGVGPIPNMTSLLEDRGVKVLVIALPRRVSGIACLVRRQRRSRRIPVIVVNREVTLERRRLTLAHELAHHLIDASSPVHHERAANVFAGAFLMPRTHLVREIGTSRKAIGYRELIQLKQMYRVSAVALMMRLQQVGVIDASALAYAFQTFAGSWRSSEPEPLEELGAAGRHELPRRFERLCYWALAEGMISLGKACELLCQPPEQVAHGLKGPAQTDAQRRE